MGVIKAAEAPPTVAAFSMQDIETTARAILLRARGRAEQILAEAQSEGEQLRKDAHERGFIEGRAAGLAQGSEEGRKSGHEAALAEHREAMQKLIQTLTAAVNGLETSWDDLENHALREVVDLSLAVARRVTKRQSALDPQVMCENLRSAMSLAVHATDVRIAVNPSQTATLRSVLPEVQLSWPQLKHVELLSDEQIEPGGVRIFSCQGQVDGTLDSQLDRVIHELLPEQASESH
jgi:flagellar assembly protein FliH